MRLFANIEETKDRKVITITESQMFDLILEAATIQIYRKIYSKKLYLLTRHTMPKNLIKWVNMVNGY